MRQLTDLFKGLMFLQGHFTHPEDLDAQWRPLGNRAASQRSFAGYGRDGHATAPAAAAGDGGDLRDCATC